jgi:circadian clock protein KaiC
MPQVSKRVHTGVPGLDEMLNGGLLPCTANLVEGAPGCGKTTLGMQFIYHGALEGEPGLILTFEQFPQQYYRDAASFGWDFRALEKQGLLKVVMSSPEVAQADLEQFNGKITRLVHRMQAKRILVENISYFERMSRDPIELRALLYSFLNALKREGLVTLLTRETYVLLGDEAAEDADQTNLSFLADSYILLRYVEIESAIRRAIIVLKMRGSAHDKRIRQFDIGSQGMVVQDPFRGREGIMSGNPRQMAESFIKAFIRR